MRRPLAVGVVLAGFALAAFLLLRGGGPETDEEQIRALVHEVAVSAGEKDVSAIMEHVSESYRGEGSTKSELKRYLAGYVLRSDWVSVVEKIPELEIEGESARAVVVALMLHGPQPEGEQIAPELVAGSHRIEVKLSKEGGVWRVTYAKRQDAAAGDWLR